MGLLAQSQVSLLSTLSSTQESQHLRINSCELREWPQQAGCCFGGCVLPQQDLPLWVLYSLCLSTWWPWLPGVLWLFPDFIYLLNALIYSHNAMPSDVIVILRLFYALTTLDMKKTVRFQGMFFIIWFHSFSLCVLVVFDKLYLPSSVKIFSYQNQESWKLLSGITI